MINVTTLNISCENNGQKISYWYFYKTVSFDNTFNTSITGLLPNTTYTCCVLAVTSYGESEPVCQNITTTSLNTTTSELNITYYNLEQYLSTSIVYVCYLHMTVFTEGVYCSQITNRYDNNNYHIAVIITQSTNTISDIIMHNSIIFNLFT